MTGPGGYNFHLLCKVFEIQCDTKGKPTTYIPSLSVSNLTTTKSGCSANKINLSLVIKYIQAYLLHITYKCDFDDESEDSDDDSTSDDESMHEKVEKSHFTVIRKLHGNYWYIDSNLKVPIKIGDINMSMTS
jgi:hypothetical protein